MDTYNHFVDQSDPEVLRNGDKKSSQNHRKKADSLPIPPEVLDLCREPENIDLLAGLDLVEEGYDIDVADIDLIEENYEVSEFEPP